MLKKFPNPHRTLAGEIPDLAKRDLQRDTLSTLGCRGGRDHQRPRSLLRYTDDLGFHTTAFSSTWSKYAATALGPRRTS